eukprot:1162092-Pelagomonas_calceolata.AAC.8
MLQSVGKAEAFFLSFNFNICPEGLLSFSTSSGSHAGERQRQRKQLAHLVIALEKLPDCTVHLLCCAVPDESCLEVACAIRSTQAFRISAWREHGENLQREVQGYGIVGYGMCMVEEQVKETESYELATVLNARQPP